ncbi:hypothetical protein HID58_047319, partial [Brassica napus]
MSVDMLLLDAKLGAFDVTRSNREVFMEISETVQTNPDGALQIYQ